MGWDNNFVKKVEKKSLVIGVVGLGYVGLPTALSFYQSGFKIWGIDNSLSVISKLHKGQNPTGDPSLDGLIPNIEDKNWNVTKSFSESIPNCDVILVTVPTPVNEDKSMNSSYVFESGESIFSNLTSNSNTIVILESTVYPGSTNELWLPLVKKYELEIGKDITLAYCPERHNPGDSKNNISTVARVIGCDDTNIGKELVYLYSELTKGNVRYVGKIEVAESAKLVENIQRDINIALVNELAIILPHLGVDVEDVLDAASSKWNFHRYKPGLGVGGHCIPIDPYFIIDKAKFQGLSANLVSSARKINELMPSVTSKQIKKILLSHYPNNKSSFNALIMGWSYKADIGDARESPSLHLFNELTNLNIKVKCYDPYFDKNEMNDDFNFINNLNDISDIDILILATAHTEFIDMDWSNYIHIMNKPLIFDGRRCLNLKNMEEIGWSTYAIGKPIN